MEPGVKPVIKPVVKPVGKIHKTNKTIGERKIKMKEHYFLHPTGFIGFIHFPNWFYNWFYTWFYWFWSPLPPPHEAGPGTSRARWAMSDVPFDSLFAT